MMAVFLFNHVLDGLGLFFLTTTVWKISRGYGAPPLVLLVP
ncbi:hypothetical protein [Bradyrhizobium barranii]|nr:hypothetical protein [Bradyrhizobium barranii]